MGYPKGSEKKRAANQAYNAKHRDKRKAYRDANKEKRQASKRAWYLKNRQHCLDYAKTYAAEHAEDMKARQNVTKGSRAVPKPVQPLLFALPS